MHKRLSEGDKHEQKEAVADFISDEYFDKQWEKQAADDEEVSMLEAFSFPKTKEQMVWKEIKDRKRLVFG